MLVMVNDTHKDRNAATRRRGCKNSNGLSIDQWIKNVVQYTMIGFADISNVFIDIACNTYLRNGASGTVTTELFERCVEQKP